MYRLFFFIFLLLHSITGLSQKLIQDTVFIDVEKDTVRKNSFFISNVKDFRNDKELSVYSIKRFIILPVDIYVFPKIPLDSFLTDNKSGVNNYNIEIHNFNISGRKGNFSTALLLEARISVFENNSDSSFIGELMYQSEYKKRRIFEKQPESYANTFKVWQYEFNSDMNAISITGERSRLILPNLFYQEKIKNQYLNINISSAAGNNWWLIDAELYFSPPEIKKRTIYVANIFRYQNHPQFESFAYGWKSEHLQYRFNNILALDASSNILLGVNKWKNREEETHGLEQLFNLNISFTQAVCIKPLNKHFYGKMGIIENMFYIYDFGFKFKPGGYITVGGRF